MTQEGTLTGNGGAGVLPHISVGVCTFKRPSMLKRLLHELQAQESKGAFTHSVVVVDNDQNESARAIVEEFATESRLAVAYVVEREQNIALARNRAVREADGDFVAFIDDDEFPEPEWLLQLLDACGRPGIAGALGPVLPHFSPDVPRWVVDGGFYDRPRHPTGTVLTWSQTRTGNTLLKRELFPRDGLAFNPQCLEGSDQEFFRRMIEAGHTFTWCDEAVVFEEVPPARWTRSFLVRRATFRGVGSVRNHAFTLRPIALSLLAVPVYAAALPIGLLAGQALFMRYVFKLSYHMGRLFAAVGINPIREPYVTE
jgi:succinoglycan biosynthesis protein ExoM